MKVSELLSPQPINEASLDIFKYKGTKKDRIPLFLQKIETESPFKAKTKTGVIDVIIDPAELDKARAYTQNPTPRFSLKIKDSNLSVPFGSIIKTKEFGGEEAGSREKIEKGQIAEIQKQLESAKAGAPSIPLVVGGVLVNAARVEKTKGSPKSDMSVYDSDGNEVAWVSLKGRPFRWGGWSHLTTLPEIQTFKKRIREITGGKLEPGNSFGMHIGDDVKRKIVYGKKFGEALGQSNVTCVLIDNPTISPAGNKFILSADTVYKNGVVPSGNDEPYLVVRYMLNRPDAGFMNARAETNTRSEGRKVQWLDAPIEKQKPDQAEPGQSVVKPSPSLNPKTELGKPDAVPMGQLPTRNQSQMGRPEANTAI